MDFRRSWLWNRRRPGQQSTILPSSQRSGAAAVAGILQPSDVVSFSGGNPHILFSLEPDETTFWMRSWPSSVLSSASCFVKSSLLLSQSWTALTLPDD